MVLRSFSISGYLYTGKIDMPEVFKTSFKASMSNDTIKSKNSFAVKHLIKHKLCCFYLLTLTSKTTLKQYTTGPN